MVRCTAGISADMVEYHKTSTTLSRSN